ncbi:SUMF1/EgtB/PvdO family nonheme iron enzyme [Chloracidobacterium sp. MS 40/45]|uniref:bifunctional serine/threonine-protein kinase/formylglycine-generating enzyme family protein n=1 Tax=Chloracidobacterium aggregatum TaxID=2851959 RepID=UPI001B8C10B8|nr:bifunctional serine/threonine-protein kinase/formylglycine-generating enzyme family protein [Chloracidobacterium aggregatum]QUV99200.1 SUMF1/EgtB/PvdO family nonheme iron enzyme [Chloracidobacterium sp. MS 40/45]
MAKQPELTSDAIGQTRLASSTSAPALTEGLPDQTQVSATETGTRAETGPVVEQTIQLGTGPVDQREVGRETARAQPPSTQPVGVETSPPKQRPVEGLAIGHRFQGKYEILRLLGVGGMGRVYQARHCELDSLVAIKIMVSSLSSDREAIERFKREARAMARVQHPNAVRVLDSGVEQGDCYLIMEFLEGETLRERMTRLRHQGTPPSLETIIRYAEQVFAVLEFMHRQNITHRDLKPDNIFLTRIADGEETVKVLDFGIAKIQTATVVGMTTEGTMVGTPRYMSPEQCRGGAIDGRADIYSMGVVLYEMLAGCPPFDGDTAIAVALKHINEPPPPLRQLNPNVPEAVAAVIHRALEKSPSQRFRTAQEFSHALLKAAGLAPAQPGLPAAGAPSSAIPSEDVPTLKRPADSGDTRPYGNGLPLDEGAARRPKKVFIAAAVVVGALVLGSIMMSDELSRLRNFILGQGATPVVTPPSPSSPATPKALENFILVPAGTFTMGRDTGPDDFTSDKRVPADETPAHQVTVPAFYLARYETTNAEYKRFVAATGHPAPRSWKQGNYPPGQDDFPVTDVSWQDARAYCDWLTKTNGDGITFRLPTEAEWEYAARGTDGRLFPWGSFWRDGTANTRQAKVGAIGQSPGDMGQSPLLLLPVNVEPNNTRDKSAFGVFGMGGNVCEWTASDFAVYPGSTYRPTGRDLECKVYRGGHFASPLSDALASSRKWTLPDKTQEFLGFRVAATPAQP